MYKKALVTGAGGQDGSYLCELLLNRGYSEVTGLVRPSGDDNTWRLKKCLDNPRFRLERGDIMDPYLPHHIARSNFDEVYWLAAQTQVMQSYQAPTVSIETNVTALTRLLELWKRRAWTRDHPKLYFAASSEMFGSMPMDLKANEDFPLAAQSPYAVAKVAGHLLCRVYRNQGMFVSSGISFNHESCRRGDQFVTRKVGLGVHKFKETGEKFYLGNVHARRDWHHAKDTVNGMWLSLQAEEPGEYVFASGVARSIKDLVADVCAYHGVYPEAPVEFHNSEIRPWDVEYLCGDASKAERVLGWKPTISWSALIEDVCRPAGEL